MRPVSSAFRLGLRDGAPFLLVVIPFAVLFGVAASAAGWDLAQTLSMSVFVIAGASQFTALQLLGDNAPLTIVILTSLAVNLRLAMYSASLAPLIGAQPFWKRAIVAYTAAGTPMGSDLDHASGYLRHMLGFMGITDVTFVPADGLAFDREAGMARAQAVLDQIAA